MKNAEALSSEMGSRIDENEIAKVLKRFGDEQSTLLDQYERLSFEVQLNKAILGRSLSEPYRVMTGAPPCAPPEKGKRRRGLGFRSVVRRLLRPILGVKADNEINKKNKKVKGNIGIGSEPRYLKAFSKSLRF